MTPDTPLPSRTSEPCRHNNCLGHPELPAGWTSWQVALHADDSGDAYERWAQTEPAARAATLGHDVHPDPGVGMSSADRWTCMRCGRAVLLLGHNIYGSAVEKQCGQRQS